MNRCFVSDRTSDQIPLLFRCDASVVTGTGHAMRCLALAQAWQDQGGRAVFAMAEATAAIEERLRSENVLLVRVNCPPGGSADASLLLNLMQEQHSAWVVTDGYKFSASYHRALKEHDSKILSIDDNGEAGTYACDLILNQNLHARQDLYRHREGSVRLLLGPSYALLRREFLHARFPRDISPVACKLLVSMGGSDPGNVTSRVLEALESLDIPHLEVAVVTGGSNPHAKSVAAACASSKHACQVCNDVANMAELMTWADLAVSAAGSVCWEYCALGLPALLVTVADNQVPNALALRDAGAAKLLSGGSQFAIDEMTQAIMQLALSVPDRRSLSEKARTLVDGCGATRVLSAMFGDALPPRGNA